MASHFDAVGFKASEPEAFLGLLKDAFERAAAEGAIEHADGLTLRYVDPSGATLTIHVDRDGQITCCQPGFAGESRFRWRPLHVVPDADGCRFCDLVYAELLDDEDGLYYPLALTIETIGATRALIPYGEAGELTFAALCVDGAVWESEAAFERQQEAEWAPTVRPESGPDDELPVVRGFAAKSLVPSGTFVFDDGGAMSSDVLAHGIVASVEERMNELGGACFKVVRLETLGGVFDTCIAPGTFETEDQLVAGAVIGGTFWLVGSPLTLRDGPGPVPGDETGSEQRGRRGLFGRRQR